MDLGSLALFGTRNSISSPQSDAFQEFTAMIQFGLFVRHRSRGSWRCWSIGLVGDWGGRLFESKCGCHEMGRLVVPMTILLVSGRRNGYIPHC